MPRALFFSPELTVPRAITLRIPGTSTFLAPDFQGTTGYIPIELDVVTPGVVRVGSGFAGPDPSSWQVWPLNPIFGPPTRVLMPYNEIFDTYYSRPRLAAWLLDPVALTWTQTGDIALGYTGTRYYNASLPYLGADDDGHFYCSMPDFGANTRTENYGRLDETGTFVDLASSVATGATDYDMVFTGGAEYGSDLLPHFRSQFPAPGSNWNGRVADVRDPHTPYGAQDAPYFNIPGTNFRALVGERRWGNLQGKDHYVTIPPLQTQDTHEDVFAYDGTGPNRYVLLRGHVDPSTYLDVIDDYRLVSEGLVPSHLCELPSGVIVVSGGVTAPVDGSYSNAGEYLLWDAFGDEPTYHVVTTEDYPAVANSNCSVIPASDTEDVVLYHSQQFGTPTTATLVTAGIAILGQMGPGTRRFHPRRRA